MASELIAENLKTLEGSVDSMISTMQNDYTFDLMPCFVQKNTDRPIVIRQYRDGIGLLEEKTSEHQEYPNEDPYDFPPTTLEMKTFRQTIRISEEKFGHGDWMDDMERQTQLLVEAYFNHINEHHARVLEDNSINADLGSVLYSATHAVEDPIETKWGSTWANLATGTALSIDGIKSLKLLGRKTLNARGIRTPLNFKYLVVPPDQEDKSKEILHSIQYPVAGYGAMPSQPNLYKMVEDQDKKKGFKNKKEGEKLSSGGGNTQYQLLVGTFLTNADDYYLFSNFSPLEHCWVWKKKTRVFQDPRNGDYVYVLSCRYNVGRRHTRGSVKMDVS